MSQGTKKVKGSLLVENALILEAQTASRALTLDGSGNVTSSATTDTELSYLSGVSSAIQTQIDGKQSTSEKGAANGYASLDAGGKVPSSQLPAIAFTEVFVVADITARDALTVGSGTGEIQEGDVVIVTDASADAGVDSGGASYIYDGAAYQRLLNPDSPVLSVNGEVGAVTLSAADINYTQATPANWTVADGSSIKATLDEVGSRLTTNESDIAGKQADVITTQGDIVIGDAGGAASRLALGGSGTVLKSNGTTASWQADTNTDEQVKVSANDTTAKYLEDAIVVSHGTNSTNPLETSTLNDGADEDFQIQFDETKVVHDNLSGFVANEHIDHSSVSIGTAADSGLSGGGDITASRSLAVNINGTTAETSAADADEILIYDASATALRKMTRANFLSGVGGASAGDIEETSFAGAQSASGANVTGFAFANGTVRSFDALVSVSIDATADLFETFRLHGVQRGADWVITTESTGDDSLVTFDISSAGQITYSSSTYAGFVSMTVKFRAITTSV